MNIEVLLTEAEIANEFAEALEARDLPEKFFYWSPLSVRAWLDLSQDGEGQRKAWTAVGVAAERLAPQFQGPVSVVSFGAGDGAKDILLLKSLQRAGLQVKYFPVDASQPLLELACAAGEDAEFESLGIKADIASPVHLVLACDAAESPKLYVMAGNTLGGFDPLDQLRHLAECLHPEDRLIVDGEIFDAASLAQDRRPLMRRFALAPLAGMGISEEDGELRLEHKRDERHAGLHMVARHFQAGRDLHLTVGGQAVTMQRGERVFLNFRYLYTPEAFRWLVSRHAGLKIVEEIIDTEGRMMTAVCAR
jgi:uncharacterized SAM-dependent methyltransferase